MLDVAIVGGDVIDGSGGPRVRADVGIAGGRVVAVGDLDERARRTIDATGRAVCPGFIDVHTHYDAQVLWDGDLTPSPLHGVTTALGGNCGFTLAPMTDEALGYVAAMLARVEGMSLSTLDAAVDVSWRTFGEYLDRLEGRVALNVGFLVGHSTVRRLVLGEDWRRAATAGEIDAMRRLVADSLAAGALGFSSSASDTHNDASGDPVPSRFATDDELLRLCAELQGHPGTWLEFIPWAFGAFPEQRIRLMAQMSAASGGRPLNWNLLVVNPTIGDDIVENRLSASDAARTRGASVFALTMPLANTIRINLETGFTFDVEASWREVLARPRAEKLHALADPEVRRRLAADAHGSLATGYQVDRLCFDAVQAPDYRDLTGRVVAEAARDRRVDPFDLMFDVALAEDLATVFRTPRRGDDPESWRRRVELWRDPRTIVGGSDAGAHLDMIDTFGFYTDFVGPTVRERQLLPLEEAVRLVTSDAARAFGLRGRGRLAPGYAADVVIFDPDRVGSTELELRRDLPAGGMRLYSEGVGIDAVLVNGAVVAAQGELTGARPGTVLRSGRDTETVVAPAR
ncbi:MAG: amidohydrolase family protein [Microbacteriaceae bacterium]